MALQQNRLTAATAKQARPSAKPRKLADGGGLYLLITPSGGRLWRFDYRFAGKQKTLALGRHPTLSLAEARGKRDAAKRLLAEGQDPGAAKQRDKRSARQAPETTFRAVAERWFKSREDGWVESYSSRIRSRLEGDIYPSLGDLPIDTIEAPLLLTVIRRIENRGAVELARRVNNYVGEVFKFGIAEGKATRDPSADIKRALKSRSAPKRRASIPARELPAFLARLAKYDGDPSTKLALRLALLTFVRTAELRFAQWGEFDLAGDAPLWRVPAVRMKMRREHLVPLAPQAVAALRELRPLAGGSRFLFPAPTRSGVMSENTMLFALYRLGWHSRATVHGFRATASTILNEQGFNSDWIERQLAHVERNAVRAAYNAAEWMPDRRRMMNWWADYLDQQAEVGELVG